MSGSSHQRKVVAKAVASVLKTMGVTPALVGSQSPTGSELSAPESTKHLGRSSVEAYLFFIVATGYAILSAFGIAVNFWAGLALSLFVGAAATDLLWRSQYTSNWNAWAKSTGTVLISACILLVINQGYNRTRKSQDPNAATLSAIQNLSGLVASLQNRPEPAPINNTPLIEVDGKYPDIELSEPRYFLGGPNRLQLVNVEVKNDGTGTAFSKRDTVGLFIAAPGNASEGAVFRHLYKHEHDKGDGIPSEDLGPGSSGIIPIGPPVLEADGNEVDDADRRALYEGTKVIYVTALIAYQGRGGRTFHKELCFYGDGQTPFHKCIGHNAHG